MSECKLFTAKPAITDERLQAPPGLAGLPNRRPGVLCVGREVTFYSRKLRKLHVPVKPVLVDLQCKSVLIAKISFLPPFFTLLLPLSLLSSFIMDSLVSTYSRSAFEDEGYSSDEQQELIQTAPPLSLKFAMPPLPNVSSSDFPPPNLLIFASPAFCLSSSLDRRPCKPKLPH